MLLQGYNSLSHASAFASAGASSTSIHWNALQSLTRAVPAAASTAIPALNDGDSSEAAMAQRVNGELANELGNLAQRSLSMIAKQLGGILPEPGEFTDNDKAILAQADAMLEASRAAMATRLDVPRVFSLRDQKT
jgi:hypothetical protein